VRRIEQHTARLAGGERMAYRSSGGGVWTLACLHGLGQSGLMWEDTIAALPDGWSGIALDLLGFGESDKPASGYSIEMHADSVLAFLDGMRDRPVVLAANSLGGVVALRVATRPSAALRGLVLVATGARVRDVVKGRAYRETLAASELDLERRRTMARGYCFRDLGPEMVDRIAGEIGKASKTAILETMGSSLETDLTASLHDVRVPTMVVQGREDLGRPPEDGLALARGIPDARLVVLPGAGHTPMLDAPAEFSLHLNATLEWWRGGSASPTAAGGEVDAA
jgi:pimeloyl-ACP methyl ester carboxylesterase